MTDKEVIKQALEALYSEDVDQQSWAKTALMKALAQPVQPAEQRAQREEFDAWWEEFSSTHEEWKYADSSALRWAAWQAAQETQPVQQGIFTPDWANYRQGKADGKAERQGQWATTKVEDTKDAFFQAGWGQNDVMWKCWSQGFAAAQPVPEKEPDAYSKGTRDGYEANKRNPHDRTN